jgi:EAL domain-containing protein (putative c-di-GMP-specific phosphodiesterase class I)
VAEGVETLEQQQFLKELGCSGLQGFLLGRPMPADEFEKAVTWKEAGDRAMKLLA